MKLFLNITIIFFLFSCQSETRPIEIQGKTMGTYYKVKTFGTASPDELKKDIDKFFQLFNKIFSTYISDSELSKINNSKFDKVKLSDSMKKVLELSLTLSQKSEGYFDVTVGPLVNAWGFGPGGKQKIPTAAEIEKLLATIGYQKLKINDEWLERPHGMYIDLSALAKGFGVDELIKFLDFKGYSQVLVEIGGEVRVRGLKPDGKTWTVGIEGPSDKLGTKIAKVVKLDNMAMATSGSYRNYLKYGDNVFNHTIDPHTGRPVTHKTISVSVIHDYCADADAWATALMSMGVEKGLKVANRESLKVYFQVKENDSIKIITSDRFKDYVK